MTPRMPEPGRFVTSTHPQWTGRYGRLSGKWGHADFEAREVVLDPATRREGTERVYLIHEMLHVLFPWMDEGAVAFAAEEIDDALDEFEL